MCTWDLLRCAYPIGHNSSTSHRTPCTAEAVMPSDHHHHLLHHHSPPLTPLPPPPPPRLTHTQHVVMRHRPTIFFGHIQFAHTRTTPIPPTFAQRRGLQSLIFDLLPVLSTMRAHTRKRPRRHCWKRSKAANRPTSCCAVSQIKSDPVTLPFRKLAHYFFFISHIGTVLDAEGTPSDHALMIHTPSYRRPSRAC